MKERSKNPATKMVAKERISILFSQAQEAFHEHPERSNRYVALARRIAMLCGVNGRTTSAAGGTTSGVSVSHQIWLEG